MWGDSWERKRKQSERDRMIKIKGESLVAREEKETQRWEETVGVS